MIEGSHASSPFARKAGLQAGKTQVGEWNHRRRRVLKEIFLLFLARKAKNRELVDLTLSEFKLARGAHHLAPSFVG